jgi:uncharacterized protein YerC
MLQCYVTSVTENINMNKTANYSSPKRLEKLSKKEVLDLSFDLINAFSIVNNPMETSLLIQDLLTKSEIKHMAKRLRIAKLLLADKTQREIANDLHCSLATVAKVNLRLEQGGEGLRRVISKLPKRYSFPKKLPPGPVEFYLPQLISSLVQLGLHNRQRNKLKGFVDKVESKRILDKEFQDATDKEFIQLQSFKKRKQTKEL